MGISYLNFYKPAHFVSGHDPIDLTRKQLRFSWFLLQEKRQFINLIDLKERAFIGTWEIMVDENQVGFQWNSMWNM